MTIFDGLDNELLHITDKDVINILRELNAYHNVRKTHHILNCQKLIDLLRLYCSFLIDERSHIRGICTMLIDNNWYQIAFRGHDSEGNSIDVSLSDGFKGFVDTLSVDLVNALDSSHFKLLTKLLMAVMQHQQVDIEHKYIIINAENGSLRETFEYYLCDLSESDIRQFFIIRKDFILERIKICKNHSDKADIDSAEVVSLKNAYKYYISQIIKNNIRLNQLSDTLDLIDAELQNCAGSDLAAFLLLTAITYNNQFLIVNKNVLEQKLEDSAYLIEENDRQFIEDALNFSLADIDLKDQIVEPILESLTEIDFTKTKTIIFATIPLNMVTDSPWSAMIDDVSITLRSIRNPTQDPIHNFLYDLGLNISGIPLTFVSDVMQDPENSTLAVVTLDSFFHPDFEIVNGQILHTDFSEIEAIWGRKYYPHKEKIVKLLRNLYENIPSEFPFGISKLEINIDLISNLLVNYIDESGKSIFLRLYTITNPDSFPKIKTKYLEKVNKLSLEKDFLGVQDLRFDAPIVSSNSLCNFISKAIEIIVKKGIELGGMYKYLWADREMSNPVREKDAQPLIQGQLQPILEVKGIQTSREVVAANGNIDYHCSYTHEGRLFKVGIELKNAHHRDLAHGLTSQLPAYLDHLGTPDGIFLVLWYKNEKHHYPTTYDTPQELTADLQKISPEKYRIRIMVIDCTRPLSPSHTQ